MGSFGATARMKTARTRRTPARTVGAVAGAHASTSQRDSPEAGSPRTSTARLAYADGETNLKRGDLRVLRRSRSRQAQLGTTRRPSATVVDSPGGAPIAGTRQ